MGTSGNESTETDRRPFTLPPSDWPGLYSSLSMMKGKGKLYVEHNQSGESAILHRIEKLTSSAEIRKTGLRLGIGDDAALFKPASGHEAILTCDWFLEGTHFLRDKHPADAVGWKCLARALSDIAAMGGVPRCFLLSLALPESHLGRWLDEFLRGLARAAKRFECVLAGGDTTRRRDILINVAVFGEVQVGKAMLRSRARPGDILFTSGQLGEAELGLRFIRKSKLRINSRDPLLRKHLYPEPRLALGRWLAEKRLASAMMDLSDGLSMDLQRLCAASGVGARVSGGKIPSVQVTGKAAIADGKAIELALHGGDDYELLFSIPRNKAALVPNSFQGLLLTAIGEITASCNVLLVDERGSEQTLESRGWNPFQQRVAK
jgi:thiamine-monophosphate kinase